MSVCFKGLDGLLELVGSVMLYTVSPVYLSRIVFWLTQDEMAEDPRDLVANALRHAALRLTHSGEHFMALYLAIHGVVKIALVCALLARILIAYPISIGIFAVFIIYQLYRYTLTHGVGLLALTALDFVVIVLIYLE